MSTHKHQPNNTTPTSSGGVDVSSTEGSTTCYSPWNNGTMTRNCLGEPSRRASHCEALRDADNNDDDDDVDVLNPAWHSMFPTVSTPPSAINLHERRGNTYKNNT